MGFKKAVPIGLEISRGYISAVELEFKDNAVFLKKSGKIELPPLLVTPSLSEENISDAEKFKEAVKTLFENAGISGKHISLAIPDASVKIAFLEFEDIPEEREKIIELIKWNLKKALPFPSDETVVDFQITEMPSQESRLYRLVIALMRKDVLEQYENLLNDCHVIPDTIIPSSFAAYNLYHDCLSEPPASALLALSKKEITVLIVKDGKPCFHRSKEIDGEKEALRELLASFSYYQDIQGNMPARIYLFDNGLEAVHLKAEMETSFGGVDIKTISLSDVINPHTKDFGVGVKGVNGSMNPVRKDVINKDRQDMQGNALLSGLSNGMNIFSGAAGAALKTEDGD
ncbi:MAG: pilus assembly protein PilM [Deltaproteobacteria bacterium]|nr:pilus assembly protein PilM [Deltaproteobacteria bacterium]